MSYALHCLPNSPLFSPTPSLSAAAHRWAWPGSMTKWSGAGFLSLGTIDILGHIILYCFGEGPVHCKYLAVPLISNHQMPVVSPCCHGENKKYLWTRPCSLGTQNSPPVENHCFIEMRGQDQVGYSLSFPGDREQLEGRKSESFYSLLCYLHQVQCLACSKSC